MKKLIVTIGIIALLSISARAKQTQGEFNSPDFFKTFKSKTARVKDIQVHYVIGGQGPVVVLIHGWPENWYEWRYMMPILAKHHTVISVDLRGAGESTVTPAGYDKKNLANDIHELLNQLGYKKYDIVGHDWGAAVGYAFAAQYPAQTNHLIVAEGIPFGKWLPNVELFWFFGFMRAKGNYAEHLVIGHERDFLSYFYMTGPGQYINGITPADANYYIKCFSQPGRMVAGFNFYRTIEQDVKDNNTWAANRLKMPVMAIGGDKHAKDQIAKVMHNVAVNVKQVVMKNTGHFIPEEQPAEFAALITDFIK